ncbi:MAG: hypothetical protein LUH07_13615 [Lachnospiraceae bacterium]|nr:hypothetical protein [Lachnospiraceae bacterium]
MKVWTSKMLAVSLAGHDKGNLYVVLREAPASADAAEKTPIGMASAEISDTEYFLLADGKRRTLDHPKKKKKKHVQLIIHLSEELLSQMQEITLDAHVRKIIKQYETYQISKSR